MNRVGAIMAHKIVRSRRKALFHFEERIVMAKMKVGVVGATGMVGQRFLTLLDNHPYFEVTALAASARSAGQTYAEAVDGRWKMKTPVPDAFRGMKIIDAEDTETMGKLCSFVFCAVNMPKEDTKKLEEKYALAEIPVVSNNSANRWTPDVPMVVPEINPEHLKVIADQRKRLGTKRGFIAVKPNCSIQSYVPALTPLLKYGVKEVVATTYQAISGAGKTFREWPEMIDNVIPFIGGEEEKSEKEPLRVWGKVENGVIVPADDVKITCQCIRIPVLYGHTAAAFVKFKKNPTKEQLIEKLESFKGLPQELGLPSAPKQFIQYMQDDNRPQITLDVNYENGMGVSIGRIREDSIYDWKFVGLSHNTLRGAAGGAVECAELLKASGYISKK
jgi:aspartate-semialdehyde dehydrogenase